MAQPGAARDLPRVDPGELGVIERRVPVAALRALEHPPVLPRPEGAEVPFDPPGLAAEQPPGSGAEEARHEVSGLAAVVAVEPPVPGAPRRL